MEKEYTTEKLVNKLKWLKVLSIISIAIGIIIFIIDIYTKSKGTFQFIGQMLDSLFILVVGIYLLTFSNKKLKKITGESITFNENVALIHSNKKDTKFDIDNKPKTIEIKLKTIDIVTQNDQVIIVNLDNYSTDTMTRKEIKEQFKNLIEKLTLSNNAS